MTVPYITTLISKEVTLALLDLNKIWSKWREAKDQSSVDQIRYNKWRSLIWYAYFPFFYVLLENSKKKVYWEMYLFVSLDRLSRVLWTFFKYMLISLERLSNLEFLRVRNMFIWQRPVHFWNIYCVANCFLQKQCCKKVQSHKILPL